jgi:hypothetical protein
MCLMDMENWNKEMSYMLFVGMGTLYWCLTYCKLHPMFPMSLSSNQHHVKQELTTRLLGKEQ